VREQLEAFAGNPRLVGVRHIVQSEPDDRFMLRPDFCRGIALLAELGLAYDILIYSRQLPAAIELVARFPGQRFVLDHCAKPEIAAGRMQPWASDLERLSKFPNVLCKLSGLVTEADWRGWTADHCRPYLDRALECFGADRLMIGSDWPVCTLAADYRRTMSVVLDYVATLSSDEQDAVLGGNAQRFWRLDETRAGSRAVTGVRTGL